MNKTVVNLFRVLAILWILSFLWVKFDVEFSHFEDGSGKITYCLPVGDCN